MVADEARKLRVAGFVRTSSSQAFEPSQSSTAGGKFMILGPNIRYAYKEYWDYYDHYLAQSHLSLVEGLLLAGYKPKTVVDRFLPYTMNNAAPTADWMIRLYLRFPLAWKLLGQAVLRGRAKMTPGEAQ
jgi:hypothetical protein